jgi:hypothetical protein
VLPVFKVGHPTGDCRDSDNTRSAPASRPPRQGVDITGISHGGSYKPRTRGRAAALAPSPRAFSTALVAGGPQAAARITGRDVVGASDAAVQREAAHRLERLRSGEGSQPRGSCVGAHHCWGSGKCRRVEVGRGARQRYRRWETSDPTGGHRRRMPGVANAGVPSSCVPPVCSKQRPADTEPPHALSERRSIVAERAPLDKPVQAPRAALRGQALQ